MSGDKTIGIVILRHIRVEQIKRHPPDVGSPHARAHNPAPHRNFDLRETTAFVADLIERDFVRVSLAIRLFLPTVVGQVLAEITKAI